VVLAQVTLSAVLAVDTLFTPDGAKEVTEAAAVLNLSFLLYWLRVLSLEFVTTTLNPVGGVGLEFLQSTLVPLACAYAARTAWNCRRT